MRGFFRLVVLLAIVFVAVWIATNIDIDRPRVRAEGELRGAAEKVQEAVSDIDVRAIAEELERTGRVVRRRTERAAARVAEATEDGRTTAAIKTKLALDPSLSALDISVDTTDGRVTLAGHAESAADVARAIEIAFEQDNVYEVISTLQVHPTRERSRPPA